MATATGLDPNGKPVTDDGDVTVKTVASPDGTIRTGDVPEGTVPAAAWGLAGLGLVGAAGTAVALKRRSSSSNR